MQFSIDKAKTAAVITIILMMASVALAAMPVKAQDETGEGAHGGEPLGSQGGGARLPAGVTADLTVTTYAYLSVTANPIGVGQTALINIWVTPSWHRSGYATDFTVTFTKPDNTTDTVTINSYYGDATAWFEYVVDQVGTWKLQFTSPGQYWPKGVYNDAGWPSTFGSGQTNFTLSRYYLPSTTPVTELVVQAEMVSSWPPAPLPTHEYWTRPVYVQNREWWPLLGNYPWDGQGVDWEAAGMWPADTSHFKQSTKYNAWAVASNTAHIVWKRLDTISGLLGGETGIYGMSSSGSAPSLIYAGRCYQTRTINMPNGSWISCATSYDLRTGQMYYAVPTAGANPGVTPTMISYVAGTETEIPGATERLGWSVSLMTISGSFLYKISPTTGLVTTNVTAMSGTFIDPWVISMQTNNTATGPRLINWTTAGTTSNFTARIVENRTVDFTSIGMADWDNMVFGSMSAVSSGAPNTPSNVIRIVGYSIKTGHLICNFTDTQSPYTTSEVMVDHGKIACLMQNGYAVAYDLIAGRRAWTSQQTYETGGYPWGIWGAYSAASYGGNYIIDLYDGIYAFNWDTGKISWVYKAASTPFETPYGGWVSFNSGCSIVDGKIFVPNSEHTTTQPLCRDWKMHVINATTGKGIWNITGPMNPGAMADGYTTAGSADGYMYVFGRGKSATTVSAPQTTVAKGTAVLIQGTVLDQSPAQPGAACVSDESQATYMEYLHMQQPIDGIFHNVKVLGVPVTLFAVDSDGTVIDIGTVTSDMSGTFSYAWTPPNEGVYKITAAFVGSESYGSSWAETAVSIGPAPAVATTQPTQPPAAAPDNTGLIYATLAAVIVAIIIGIIAILVGLRKRQ